MIGLEKHKGFLIQLILSFSLLFNLSACATDHYHQAIQNGEKLCN